MWSNHIRNVCMIQVYKVLTRVLIQRYYCYVSETWVYIIQHGNYNVIKIYRRKIDCYLHTLCVLSAHMSVHNNNYTSCQIRYLWCFNRTACTRYYRFYDFNNDTSTADKIIIFANRFVFWPQSTIVQHVNYDSYPHKTN